MILSLLKLTKSLLTGSKNFSVTKHLKIQCTSNEQLSSDSNQMDRTNLLEISSPTQQQTQLRQDVDQAIRQLIKTTTELRLELQQTSLELASSLIHNCWRQGGEILALLKSCAFSGDMERLQQIQQVKTMHVSLYTDVR